MTYTIGSYVHYLSAQTHKISVLFIRWC